MYNLPIMFKQTFVVQLVLIRQAHSDQSDQVSQSKINFVPLKNSVEN